MEAIIDTVESFIYGDPCKGDEPVDTTHRIVTTNIEGSSIKDRIQKAQVVILLERHGHHKILHLNGRVIRHHVNKGDVVLCEGSKKPEYLPYSLRSSAKSWDLERSAEHKTHFDRLINITHNVAFILPLYITILLDKKEKIFRDLTSGFKLVLNSFYPNDGHERFKVLEELDPQRRIDYLMKMAKECLSELREHESKCMAILSKEFFSRNVNLTKTIEISLKKHPRVWVIAGEAHGRYIDDGENEKQGVTHLYQFLETQKVHYVALKWFDKELEEKAYNHCMESTQGCSIEQQKVSQQEFEKLRQRFNREFPRSFSPVLEWIEISNVIESKEGVWDIHDASDFAQLVLERTLTWD